MRKSVLFAACLLALGAPAAEEGKDDRSKAGAAPQRPPEVIRVETVIEESLARPYQYIGHVEAAQEVALQARISAFIQEQKFEEGSVVKRGELLFMLEDTAYLAKVQSAKAQVAQIQAELEFAESNYNRQRALMERNAAAQAVFDEAKRLIGLTKGRYDAARAALLEAENELSYARIYAPITGKIGKVTYTEGNYVNLNSSPLASIVQQDPINVKFSISDREYLELFSEVNILNKDLKLELELANREIYDAKNEILLSDNKIDPNTGTIAIWVSFENPQWKLIPGGYVRVILSKKDTPKTASVKVTAIMTDNEGNYVYVVDDENNVSQRRVALGDLVGNRQLILTGLTPGERVVIDGNNKIFPGSSVVIAD